MPAQLQSCGCGGVFRNANVPFCAFQAAAASTSAYQVYPAAADSGGGGRALPPALRLLRSNTEAFSDGPRGGAGREAPRGRLDIPSRGTAGEEEPAGDSGGGSDMGGPAQAARRRARLTSAALAARVKVRCSCLQLPPGGQRCRGSCSRN